LVEWRKILVLVRRLRKLCKFRVAGAIEISDQELSLTRVDASFITAVVIVKDQVAESRKCICDKCRSERLGLLEENCRMLCFKLTI